MSTQLFELEPEDYNRVKEYFSMRHPGTCESIILDSYLWKKYYKAKYILNGKGLLWILNAAGEVFSLLPLSKKEDLKECFYDLKKYYNTELNQKMIIYLADEEAVEILDLNPDEFVVEEDRRYFDYVYDAQGLRTLSGKKYHKKKNHANAFYKEYGERYEFRRLNCDDKAEIYRFLETWKESRNIEDEYDRIDYEYEGIVYVLENCKFLQSICGGIFIDGHMEAFSIGSYSETEKTAYIHVEKANPEIRGLYNAINQQFLIHCFPEAEFVNREDDMGLEGLRHAKMSYQPVKLVKKFNIIEK